MYTILDSNIIIVRGTPITKNTVDPLSTFVPVLYYLFPFLEGLKSMTGPLIFEQLEHYFNIPALETVQNANLPLVLQTSSAGAQSTLPIKVESAPAENTYAEFQLPLKGFYRHFKEMTETSMYKILCTIL